MVKFIFYAMLFYLLVRAALRLVRIIAGREGLGAAGRASGRPPGYGSNGRSAPRRDESARATRLREDEDIEDAVWEDL